VACLQRAFGIKPYEGRGRGGVESCVRQINTPLEKQESPEMPIPALRIVHMHGPDGVNTPRMPDAEVSPPKGCLLPS